MRKSRDEQFVSIGYLEAGCMMAALDFALCNQGKPGPNELDILRPLVDKMSSTFGFSTERLDLLLKGKRVHSFKRAFETQRMHAAEQRRIKRLKEAKRLKPD